MIDFQDSYPRLLGIPEVADILDVSPNTIRKLIKNGNLHAVKVGKRYKITQNNLLIFLGETIEHSRKETCNERKYFPTS